jgi:hypothetical protein
MTDQKIAAGETNELWLDRKIRSGKLLTLPTYYPANGGIGQRPDKFARKLREELQGPGDLREGPFGPAFELSRFRRWVESSPQPRPIHPALGRTTLTEPVEPEGVTWLPPCDSGRPIRDAHRKPSQSPSASLGRGHFRTIFPPRRVTSAVDDRSRSILQGRLQALGAPSRSFLLMAMITAVGGLLWGACVSSGMNLGVVFAFVQDGPRHSLWGFTVLASLAACLSWVEWRTISRNQAGLPRRRRSRTSGVYDHWLDG